ncbi:MAG TPA: TolC family outer membrane protein [Acetobacteraceae bacterium]|jgi:outer membrane protein|nr:TolC family outer membrane protein [Acetobacteraceae bacterium]
MRLRTGLAIGGILATVAAAQPAAARTLQEALALAYATNPTLLAARAQLRSVDENVPAALAGWRPTVTFAGTAGPATGKTVSTLVASGTTVGTNENRNESSLTGTVTQPLYRGGRTVASTNRAENLVDAQRAALQSTEQTVFSNATLSYINVIQDQQILALDVNNEQVLAKQLQATNDRFRVGEITRTDVAQAEAALAGATATRQAAEGTLATAQASYEQFIGERPVALVEPQPLRLPTRTLDQARALASTNNPNVVQALFTDAGARDFLDVQYSALMPNVSLQGSVFRTENVTQKGLTQNGTSLLATLTVPIFQGGSEYAAVRQARQSEQQARKQVDDARRTAVQAVVSAWQTYVSDQAAIASTRSQIRANQIALEGVEREAIVGSRTTLDVLNAQQLLLQSQTTLVQALASFVNASYSVAAGVGRLTARDLGLGVPLYDETAYYKAVKNLWIGTGDFATDQPGR